MTVRRFAPAAESVAAARRVVRAQLAHHDEATVGVAELLVSELATNSVRHAACEFELRILDGREIRIELSDGGEGIPSPRAPTAWETSGRGLRIVDGLAKDWGVLVASDRKTVWFTLDAPLADGAKSAPQARQQRADAGRGDGVGEATAAP